MKTRRVGCIYKIINDINDKVYIGQTIYDIQTRFMFHCSKKVDNMPINLAIRKYGKEHFKIIEIFNCFDTLDNLNFMERYFIASYNSMLPNGYNGDFGGRNRIPTRESIEKQKDKVSKLIIGTNLATGETISFKGRNSAPKFGFTPDGVNHVIRGEQKAHRGWTFKYANQSGSSEENFEHAQRLGHETQKVKKCPTRLRLPNEYSQEEKDNIISVYNKVNSTYKAANILGINRNKLKKLLKTWEAMHSKAYACLHRKRDEKIV